MQHTADILVVGAGLGYDVLTVAPARPADERTSALLAGSIAFLDRLGVWERAKASAAPMRSLRLVDATGRLIRAPEVTFHAAEIGLDAFGWNIANTALTDALEAVFAERGLRRLDAAVVHVAGEAGQAVATLSDGGTVSAKLVVAADGRRSKVRESVGIGVGAWRYDQAALVVNLRHTRPHEDTSTEFHTEAGPFTLVPLPGLRSSLVWVSRPADAESRMALSDDALAAEIETRSASLLGATSLDGRRQVFPLSGMNAARFAAGRAVLVGEAGHLFPPIGAQGLNLGYRDVADLGTVLARRPADPGAADRLAAYDRARRADVLTRTAAVDALNRTLLTGFLPVQGLRGLGLFLLDRVPALRRALMRQGVDAA
ncbi:MAG TPA: UbiH/UbiF family hydroxylase [Bauldia sp.]|nr:UbiH/UbiF family hydroxylase [Bauldia sp.]